MAVDPKTINKLTDIFVVEICKWLVNWPKSRGTSGTEKVMIAGSRGALIFKMAAIARDSSRFAGIKTVSEKFSQPEVDAEGRVRKVCDQFLKLKDPEGFL